MPENDEETKMIKTNSAEIEQYLIFELNALDVIEENSTIYTIKTVKSNIGI